MQPRTLVLLVLVIVSNALGNVVLGYGMKGAGPDAHSPSAVDLLSFGIARLGDPWVLAGIALLAIYFAAHTLLLSWADLSYVLLVTSIGYVLVAFLSATFLGETVTPSRWAGTVLIACGVGLVGSTPESTARSEP